jgi:phage terminase large subunit-like protein
MNVNVHLASRYRGLIAFCELIGEPLEPHEKRIAPAHFGPEREVVAILPRGNLKTTLAAKVGLHHLLTVENAAVTIGAASRDQARILFERMRGFAQHSALDGQLVIRHLELRHEDEDGHLRLLRVVASDGARVHGLSSTLYLGDEIWAWAGDDLLEAMQTGLVKHPAARLLGISTAAAVLDSPLGRLRTRALAGTATRNGPLLDATAPGLRWLEWSLPEDASPHDMREVKRCNPAAYITPDLLREQAQRVTPRAFQQFHCCQWGAGEGAWLPAAAWSACAGKLAPADEAVYLGVDIGGSRAASALVGVTAALQVAEIHIYNGDDAVLNVTDTIVEIAERRPVVEVAYDPWRYHAEALRLERDHGLDVVEFPQSHARMTATSEHLHTKIVNGELQHPNDPALNRHIANAVAKQTGRGWRLDRSDRTAQIDAVIALAMCVERAANKPAPSNYSAGSKCAARASAAAPSSRPARGALSASHPAPEADACKRCAPRT